MRKLNYFLAFILLSFSFSIFAQQSNPFQNETPGNIYAVLIGISHYENKAIQSLTYANKDATLFAEFLQTKSGGSVPTDRIKILLNEKATIAAIYNALDWLKDVCKENDIAYVFFSGHGDVETEAFKNAGYLLAYNSPANNYRNNAISIDDINDDANTLTITNKAKVVLITDACRSGKLAGDFIKGKQLAAQNLSVILNNQIRMASCKPDELAAEGPEWGGGRGVYSYHLLRGLYGFADENNDGKVPLEELTNFLNTSFSADEILKRQGHKQQPVLDGHPRFLLSTVDANTFATFQQAKQKSTTDELSFIEGLEDFSQVSEQPMDAFMQVMEGDIYEPQNEYEDFSIEGIIPFKNYEKISADRFLLQLVNDLKVQQAYIEKRIADKTDNDSLNALNIFNVETLEAVRDQLTKDPSAYRALNDRFIELVHKKSQQMVNAYLAGDLEELERRQYYYTGKRDYADFLQMLQVAIQVAPPNHRILPLLKVQQAYLGGLIERLQMPLSKNVQVLRNKAISFQQKAMDLEPYAAYIHNEMGNLLLQEKRFDSAGYHFSIANELAPTWAIPWSNMMRMHLLAGNTNKAMDAARVADSLQPGVSFVQMNKGLVMEKEKNLLAAETFYLQAIEKNDVHFLPYERLGQINLEAGKFERADDYLFDASLRKNDFGVNSEYFHIGLELGGPPRAGEIEGFSGYCDFSSIKDEYLKPYTLLAEGLFLMKMDTAVEKKGLALLEKAIKLSPDMMFASHYLGKYYFKTGEWQKAEKYIQHALSNYGKDTLLFANSPATSYVFIESAVDSCLKPMLAQYSYDKLEDYYLLAAVYEKKKMNNDALLLYRQIAVTENERMMDQANLKGAGEALDNIGRGPYFDDYLIEKYEMAPVIGGYLKEAALFEKIGDYEKAEAVLLNQQKATQLAGSLRQLAINNRKPGYMGGGSPINYYSLTINNEIENAGYDFYRRMLSLFPREPQWYKKASNFLYHRLRMAYTQMEPAVYVAFTQSIGEFAYPWMGSEEGPNEYDKKITIPGTGETVIIEMPVYNPVEQSLQWMEKWLSLTQTNNPDEATTQVMADLHSWLGNTNDAVKWWRLLISKQPGNDSLRKQAIQYFTTVNYLTDAYAQLDSLHAGNKLQHTQHLQLAEYHMLAGKYQPALDVLQTYTPADTTQLFQSIHLKANINRLMGNSNLALQYLNDSLPVINLQVPPPEESMDRFGSIDARYSGISAIAYTAYAKARIYASAQKYKNALAELKIALENGFNYRYVLSEDKVWDYKKVKRRWNKLIAQYPFERDYKTDRSGKFENPIEYRIPNWPENIND